jgi:hypothetical protein
VALLRVEGERAEALVLHPEALVHLAPEPRGVVEAPRGRVVVLERRVDLGHPDQRDVVERLLVDRRDRIRHDAAVGVADRLVGILPALVLETVG